MYDFFRGQVVAIDARGYCSFAVGGVGYLLRISEQTRAALPLDGSETTVHARLIVRDDDLLLFGFADPSERAAFDLLTEVQGVGPAVALAICSSLSVDALRGILATRDIAALTKIKGVGRKTAERLALELSDKVERIPAGALHLSQGAIASATAPERDDAYRALIALGFGAKESAEALLGSDPQLPNDERVRNALLKLR